MKRNSELLHLTLGIKWFDMIDAGEKREEYREINKFWCTRLLWNAVWNRKMSESEAVVCSSYPCLIKQQLAKGHLKKAFSYLCLHRGHTSDKAVFEIAGFDVGFGWEKWGAPQDKQVFRLRLGKRLDPAKFI